MPAPEWIHRFLDLLPPEKVKELVEYIATGVLPPVLEAATNRYEQELELDAEAD